jgi:hypothetical protein
MWVCRNAVPAIQMQGFTQISTKTWFGFYIIDALHLVFPHPGSYKYFAALRLALPSAGWLKTSTIAIYVFVTCQ